MEEKQLIKSMKEEPTVKSVEETLIETLKEARTDEVIEKLGKEAHKLYERLGPDQSRFHLYLGKNESFTPTIGLLSDGLFVGGYAGCCKGLVSITELERPGIVSFYYAPSVHDIIPVKLAGEKGTYFLMCGDGCVTSGYELVRAVHTKRGIETRFVGWDLHGGLHPESHIVPRPGVFKIGPGHSRLYCHDKISGKTADLSKYVVETFGVSLSDSIELILGSRKFRLDSGIVWRPTSGGYSGKEERPREWQEAGLEEMTYHPKQVLTLK